MNRRKRSRRAVGRTRVRRSLKVSCLATSGCPSSPATHCDPTRAADSALPRAKPAALFRWQHLRRSALGLAVLSMAGCSFAPLPFPGASGASAPQPLLRIQGQQLTEPMAYAMGKAALSAGDLQRALLHFEQALNLHPASADAENGRLVALARLGRVDEAIANGQRAVALGIHSAELHGNLGMLLDERGDSRRAAIHLSRAAQLDPANPAWQRWTMAEAVAAEPKATAGASRLSRPSTAVVPVNAERIVSASAEADTLRWIQQAPQVLQLATAPARTASAQSATLAPASAAPPAVVVLGPATPAVTSGEGQITQAASAATTPQREAAVLTARPITILEASQNVLSRIEISNGHGRKGLARDMASGLQTIMSGPARVTNHAHFRVLQTEVQYRSADERAAALVLAHSLGVSEDRVVLNARLRESAPVRLLLGRDAPDTREAITDTLARARRAFQG